MTTFVAGTTITSDWLNGVDDTVNVLLNGATTTTVARQALGFESENISVGATTPVLHSTVGEMTSNRILGQYSYKSGTTTGPYFMDYDGDSDIDATDVTKISSLGQYVTTGITDANISMAYGCAYGTKKAGIGFVSGTALDAQRLQVSVTPTGLADINAVLFGYATTGPRILAQNISLYGDLPNTLDYIATTHRFTGNILVGKTITDAGSTGAQTINKTAGSVNFAAGAGTGGLIVTNNLCTEESIVVATVATNDTTLKSVCVVVFNGSFHITANANATAETRINWILIN